MHCAKLVKRDESILVKPKSRGFADAKMFLVFRFGGHGTGRNDAPFLTVWVGWCCIDECKGAGYLYAKG